MLSKISASDGFTIETGSLQHSEKKKVWFVTTPFTLWKKIHLVSHCLTIGTESSARIRNIIKTLNSLSFKKLNSLPLKNLKFGEAVNL